MTRLAIVAGAIAAVAAGAGCSNLPELGACGNGIVEAGEACDEDSDLCDFDCELVCATHDQVVAAGVESEYVNLDPEDDLADARFCPDGYGCGVDDVCRIGAARFRPIGDPVALDSDLIQVGDVDADDIADVIAIGNSQVSVLYGATGEDAFSTAAVLPGPIVTGRPFAADLDTDGATDLLIPSLSGLIRLESEGGELRGALGVSTRPLPDIPGGIDPSHVEALVARSGPLGDRDASGIGFAQVPNGVAEFEVGGGIQTCGSPGAELVPGFAFHTGSLGDSFAVGIKTSGGDLACVFIPQGNHSWTKFEVDLPLGLQIDPSRGHVVFAKLVAGRECPSLVVPAVGPVGAVLLQIDGAAASPCGFASAAQTTISAAEIEDDAVLAAGDFVPDGDGLDELVTSAGLAYRKAPDPYHYVFSAYALSSGGWSGAVVGDIDGDNRDDVVASQLNQFAQRDHDLAVVLTRDDATFNPVVVDTLGAVKQIVTGDFDGNLAADVAFVEDRGTDPDTGEAASAVSVLYGNVGALPDAPLVFDTLTGEVRLISVGPRSGPQATVLEADALDDLGVVQFSTVPPITEFGLGIAFGTAGRFLASPQWFGPSNVQVIGTVAADFGAATTDVLDVGVFVRADTEASCTTQKLPVWFWPDDEVAAGCDDASAFPQSDSFAVTSAINVAGDRVIVAAVDGRTVIADKFGGGDCPGPTAIGASLAASDLAAADVDAGAPGDELIAAFGRREQNQSIFLIPAVDDCTVAAPESWTDLTAAAGRDEMTSCAAAVAVPPPLDGNADAGWATIVAACPDHHLVTLRHRDGALSPWGVDAEIDGDPITAVAGDFTGDGVDDVAVVSRLGGIATLTVFAQCAATDQDPACGAR